ncbi:glycerol-3-phosphate dehydrogenase/oxidase [Marinobacter arenosus]|uniref:glycerol-3-phosphate dehydrogenase/oxidase n=1 Tax=Marinobacter arenosus TaxID=2856822 RepID=UPI001C4DC605|nr:glycerol-3-phosphate dehydrogenase/oxidase [Marinobacter arenosus]MBW0146128.1 glycerol-3-phosphate dehydrogenase/oxidase [Marinobacter arenosus]
MTIPRDQLLGELRAARRCFDVIVIGGGITGAGVAREAAGSGLRTLLVEQKDFAWGTSSRSSKMVHGGLRYLGSGQYRLTRDAVRERQRLLAEAPGLIRPLRFLMPHFHRQFPSPGLFQILLAVYDRISGVHSRRLLNRAEATHWAPGLTTNDLIGASVFSDAVTDDARLVQRIIAEARKDGAVCLNYVKALEVKRTDGKVSGVRLQAEGSDEPFDVSSPLVINATGAWADRLQTASPDQPVMNIRPLRGSHLVVPWTRLPVSCSISLLHPEDKRPVFAFPWEGATVLGTTDLDHSGNLDDEPRISGKEVDYLLKISERLFPSSNLSRQDILSTWAGVRPIVTDGSGKAPSKENREHEFQEHEGLISISGGKLTTFRLIAREALARGLGDQGARCLRDPQCPVFTAGAERQRPPSIGHLTWNRLTGYYGPDLESMLADGCLDDVPVDGKPSGLLWSELRWACSHEDVHHLDDLLLRRTRLGLIAQNGAQDLLPTIRRYCQPVLGWTDERWEQEEIRYREIRMRAYALPDKESGDDQ